MRRVIAGAIRRPVGVATLALAAVALGAAAWRQMPRALLPDAELPRLEAYAFWRGASPEMTEALLTARMEGVARQLRGVRRVTSLSSEANGTGMAQVTVSFARGTAMRFARLELGERLSVLSRTLPRDVWGPLVAPYVPPALQSGRAAFLRLTVAGGPSADALRAMVETAVLPVVRPVPGVADATLDEPLLQQVRVMLDPLRAEARGITPALLGRVIGEPGAVRDAGTVRSGGLERAVRVGDGWLPLRDGTLPASEAPTGSAAAAPWGAMAMMRAATRTALPVGGAALAALPLAGLSGGGRLGQAAAVRVGYAQPEMAYRVDGRPAVSFTIYRRPGTDAIALGRAITARMGGIPALRTSGIRLLVEANEGAVLADRLGRLRARALTAAALIALVLLGALRSWRAAAAALIAIAMGELAALVALRALGLALHLPTLGGLALGGVLGADAAVAVLQGIRARAAGAPCGGAPCGGAPSGGGPSGGGPSGREQQGGRAGEGPGIHARMAGPSPAAHALRGATGVAGGVLAGTAAALVVLIPLNYLPADLRLLYIPFAAASGLALVGIVVASVLVLPVLGAQMRGAARPTPSRWRGGCRGAYERLLRATLARPRLTVACAGAALAACAWLVVRHAPTVPGADDGTTEETVVEAQVELPPGTPLSLTDAVVRPLERRALRQPGVGRVVTRVQPASATVTLRFAGAADALGRVAAQALDSLRAGAALVGGATVRVVGSGAGFPVGGGSAPRYAVAVFGYDYQTTERIAGRIAARLARYPRVRRVDTTAASADDGAEVGARELQLRPDRARLAALGLSPAELASQVSAVLSGVEGPDIQLGRTALRLRVERGGANALDTRSLAQVLVATPAARVRLGALATLEERTGPERIAREDQRYRRLVRYEFRGPPELGNRLYRTVLRTTSLPPGFSLGAPERGRGAAERPRLIVSFIAAAVLLYLVAAAALERPRGAWCVLLTIPAALAGIAVLLTLTARPVTREVVLGALVMAGVVAGRGLTLVHAVERRRVTGCALVPAVAVASSARAPSLALGGLVTTLGALPFALAGATPGERVWQGAAVALLGGVPAATLAMLVILPAAYLIAERRLAERRLAERRVDRCAARP